MAMKNKTLLFSINIKHCSVTTFRCPGKGGQNVNKVETGVRVRHEPSGAEGKSCDERSQWQNKKIAFRRMAESKPFQAWVKTKAAGFKPVSELVEEAMHPKNIKVEILTPEGKWEDAKQEL